MWQQARVTLKPKSRGFHLVTQEILEQVPALREVEVGIAHFFLQHTSASLTVNENADPTVRSDMEHHFNHYVPENAPYYQHTYEGADDMPAHIKSSVLGNNVTIPIGRGRLLLGTWQGIYLGEHRDAAGSRTLIVTVNGE